MPATPDGRRYFLLLVDDATRYMWVALLTTKGAAADAIKHLQAAAEKRSGKKLRTLRTDNGREFTVAEFAAYCAEEGIQRHYSAPYTPQQNGVVERRNQTVVAMARALLKQRGLPARFWGEAVVTAVHLLNRAPTKALKGVTPYEAWHGKAPEVGYLRTFGCVAFSKDLSQLKKLDDRSIPGILIGYADGAKAYRIFDPATQRVRVSRDVVFDESRGWDWIKEGGGQAPAEEEFAVEHAWEEGTEGARTPTLVSPVSSPSLVPSAPHSPSPAPGEQGSPGTEDSTPLFQEESTPAAPIPPLRQRSSTPRLWRMTRTGSMHPTMMSPSATARWRTSSATTLLQVRRRDSSPSSTSLMLASRPDTRKPRAIQRGRPP